MITLRRFIILINIVILIFGCSNDANNKKIEEQTYTNIWDLNSQDIKDLLSPIRLKVMKDNIIILDRYAPFIKFLNKKGELINQFGKNGMGPGEMQRPSDLYIITDSTLAVYDAKRRNINYYNDNGKFLYSVSLNKLAFSLEIDNNNQCYFVTKEYINIKEASAIFTLYYQDSTKKLLAIDSIKEVGTFLQEPEYTGPFAFPFQGRMEWLVLDNNNIFVVHSDSYTIKIYNSNHEKILEKQISAPKIKLSNQDKEIFFNKVRFGSPTGVKEGAPTSIRNQISFPDYKPYITTIYENNPRKLIYLKTSRGDEEFDIFDVFNYEGKLIKSFKVKKSTINNAYFYGDIVYDIETDDDGLYIIKKLEQKKSNS